MSAESFQHLPLKSVHYTSHFDPTGTGIFRSLKYFHDAVSAFGGSAHIVSVDAPGARPHDIDGVCVEHVQSRRVPLFGEYRIVGGQEEKLIERMPRPDVVFAHGLYRDHCRMAAKHAKAFDVPLLFVPHGALDPYVFTYRSLRKRLWLKAFSREFERSTVLCSTRREAEKASLAIRSSLFEVLPWPVGIHKASGVEEVPASISDKDRSCRRACFVGRLHPMKRLEETVIAFLAAAVQASDRWVLEIAGGLTAEINHEKLKRIAGDEYGRTVIYRGSLGDKELVDLYKRSDFTLLLSHRENFGHTVAESLCLGTAVAVSDGVDLFPLVEEHRLGYVWRPGGGSTISEFLADVLGRSREEFLAHGARGAAFARQAFSEEQFSRGLLETCIRAQRPR
ncbi:MAG: hypothetical protein B7Z55_07810 [Planctomycetales bacterium 12-60-4]|nr:MAG: hypothetical protein B7Z55_07810 [Planctomycetales bacterium 12-60-4]